jgi:hypothetical protein
MTSPRRRKALARHLFRLSDEEVMTLVRTRWGFDVPSADHLRMSAALQADLPRKVRALMATRPGLGRDQILEEDLLNWHRPDHPFSYPPLVVALRWESWRCMDMLLGHPAIDPNFGGPWPSSMHPLNHVHINPVPVFPVPGSSHWQAIDKLLLHGADPLWDSQADPGAVASSFLARTLTNLYTPGHDGQGHGMMLLTRLIRAVTKAPPPDIPDVSPLPSLPPGAPMVLERTRLQPKGWPDFVSHLTASMNRYADSLLQGNQSGEDVENYRTYHARGVELTGVDLPTWPDQLLVWLVKQDLPRQFIGEALVRQPRVVSWMEEEWLKARLAASPHSLSCRARL